MNNKLEKLPIIILAAGSSNRMGKPKGLLNYQGQSFLSYQLNTLFQYGFTQVIVVLGKDSELYLEKISELKKAKVVINPQPEKGQFSSLLCSLEALPENCPSAVFILPVDVPCPKKEVWEHLFLGLDPSFMKVAIPVYQERRGHPVLLSNDFKNYLLTCNSSSRLDFEIKKQEERHQAKLISVRDKNILLNLNTLADWKKFEEQ